MVKSAFAGLLFLVLFVSPDLFSFQTQFNSDSVSILLDVAEEDLSKGDYSSVREKTERAMRLSQESGDILGIQRSMHIKADVYLNEQFFDSAQYILEQGLEMYPEGAYKSEFQNLLATAFRYQNKPSEAIDLYQIIIAESDSINDKRTIAAARLNMAVAYVNLGNKAEAIRNFMEGISFAEAERDTQFLVIAINNLGDAYNGFGDPEQAEYYLRKAIDLSREKGFRTDLLRALMNLANTISSLERPDEALKLYTESLEIHREVRPNTPPFQLLYNIGNLYLRTGNLAEAETRFIESLEYCTELGIPQGIYYNTTGLGNLEMQRGDYRKAREWYMKAGDVAEVSNSAPFLSEFYMNMYELNKISGGFEEALINFENYKNLSDSLNNERMEREFTELESRLELSRQTEINQLLQDKQAQQERQLRFQYLIIISVVVVLMLTFFILYLVRRESKIKTKANQKLDLQRRQLEKLNAEMIELFAIIAHDLRGPVSSMHGLVYLMKSGGLTTEEFQGLLEDLAHTTKRNLDVMEELFSWSSEIMKGLDMNMEEVDIFPIVDSVIEKQMMEIKSKEVVVVNSIHKEGSTVKGNARVLSLIFRNLLANSIKYSKSGGQIKFSSQEDTDSIKVIIADEGEGMSEELLNKIIHEAGFSVSKAGTKGEKGTGFGLSMVKEFVRKLDGDIQIESTEGQGTVISVSLPRYLNESGSGK